MADEEEDEENTESRQDWEDVTRPRDVEVEDEDEEVNYEDYEWDGRYRGQLHHGDVNFPFPSPPSFSRTCRHRSASPFAIVNFRSSSKSRRSY